MCVCVCVFVSVCGYVHAGSVHSLPSFLSVVLAVGTVGQVSLLLFLSKCLLLYVCFHMSELISQLPLLDYIEQTLVCGCVCERERERERV